jgi:hypothetical protein
VSEFRPSRPGERRGGRKKGTPNKTTTVLKEAILLAAEAAGGKDGLVGYLTVQAKKHPGPFLALLAKLIPLQAQVTGKDGGPIQAAVFVPSIDVIDAADRYAKLLRGEDITVIEAQALPAPVEPQNAAASDRPSDPNSD